MTVSRFSLSVQIFNALRHPVKMDAAAYIISRLEQLKAMPSNKHAPKTHDEMADALYAAVASKKFRKYGLPDAFRPQ
jgi:hypothetical protein